MNIWFIMDSIRWTPERIDAVNSDGLGGSVGGTEAMTVGLCRRLVMMGHQVTLWVTKLDVSGMYAPIRWRPIETELRRALLDESSPDVMIAVRRPQVFSLPEMRAVRTHRILWAGDVLEKQQGYVPFLANVDTVVYVSEWQRRQWESVHQPLASQFFSWITPVAMDERWIVTRGVERDHQTFIYSSQPDRGLGPLLQMWPRIRQALPEARLLVTGYTAELTRIMIYADRLIQNVNKEVGGIETRRSSDKLGYYQCLAQARLLTYPGAYFEETNGHVCSDAMASGVIPLVSRLGALPETVPEAAGILIDGDALSEAYQDAYIAEVIRLASPNADAEVARRQIVGREHVLPRCTYSSVAALWDERLRDLPRERLIAC